MCCFKKQPSNSDIYTALELPSPLPSLRTTRTLKVMSQEDVEKYRIQRLDNSFSKSPQYGASPCQSSGADASIRSGRHNVHYHPKLGTPSVVRTHVHIIAPHIS